MNDGTLLQQYRSGNHEDSFREVVQRHLGLVRGVAGRTLGGMVDAGAIDDVAMRVFATMARKAESLEDRASLAGWLVVATRQESLRHARNERTRHAAMKAYADEGKADLTKPEEAAWTEALPHLDAALAHLSETDREAVILRFYDDRGFREISAVLGRGEDAARKRVSSALEKMSAYLRRSGVVLPAAVLGAGLASGLKAEAATGAAGIANKALAFAALPHPLTLWRALQSHPAAAMLSAVLVVGASTGGGYVIGHAASKQSGPAPSSNPPSQLTISPVLAVPSSRTDVVSPVSLTLEQLADELVRRRRSRPPEIGVPSDNELMNTITPGQFASLIALLDSKYRGDFHVHDEVVGDLFRRWARAEPQVAGDAVVQRWKNGTCELWQARGLLGSSIYEWGKTNGPAALAWLELQQMPRATFETLAQTLFGSMAKTDPAAAVQSLAGMSWEDRCFYLKEMSLPEDAQARASFTEKLAAIPDEETRSEIFLGTFAKQSSLTLAEFQSLKFSSSDSGWTAMRVMADRMAETDHDPQRALDFLWDNAPQEARPAICRNYLTKLRLIDPPAAAAWMKTHHLTEAGIQASIQSLERK